MATIYFIRHGQASFGAANYDKLSNLGEQQAAHLGQHLQASGVQFDSIYSGTLTRQRDTASIAAKQFDTPVMHHIDARFNELDNAGHFNQLAPELAKTDPFVAEKLASGIGSSKDYQKVLQRVFAYWQTLETCEGTATWAHYKSEVRAAVADIMSNEGAGKNIAVFTSGGTIATIVAAVLDVSDDMVYQFYEPVINCSITQCLYSGSRISLSSYNDHSYLLGDDRLVTYR